MQRSFTITLLIWLVICLIQAAFTDLHPDEAYYWVYSQHLDWGHFHQPPMIAVFIKAGYALFQNELGVRLLTVLSNLLVIIILYDLIKPKKILQFVLILSGLFFVHVSALLAVPDSPLILFGALFLWLLNKYLDKNSWGLATALGLVSACMLYSKYHAVVFLFLCVLPNPALLRRLSFWIIPVLAFLLFLPHLNWQMVHDYPSFRFHLFNREMEPWTINWLFEFIGVQLLLLGPVGIYLLILSRRSRSENQFTKTLWVLMLGMFSFFTLLSLRNKVESNWTALAYLPLIILGAKSITKSPKWLMVSALVFIAATLLVRIEIITAFIKPAAVRLNFKYAYYSDWARAIKKEAGDYPVIFMDSYQLPSLYWFYTGDKTTSFNTSAYPGNQYDYYNFQHSFENDTVLVVKKYLKTCDLSIPLSDGELCYHLCPEYRSYNMIRIEADPPAKMQAGSTKSIPLHLKPTPGLAPTPLPDYHTWWPSKPEILITWIQKKELQLTNFTDYMIKEDYPDTLTVEITAPEKPGTYLLSMGIRSIVSIPGRNSYFYRIEVTE